VYTISSFNNRFEHEPISSKLTSSSAHLRLLATKMALLLKVICGVVMCYSQKVVIFKSNVTVHNYLENKYIC